MLPACQKDDPTQLELPPPQDAQFTGSALLNGNRSFTPNSTGFDLIRDSSGKIQGSGISLTRYYGPYQFIPPHFLGDTRQALLFSFPGELRKDCYPLASYDFTDTGLSIRPTDKVSAWYLPLLVDTDNEHYFSDSTFVDSHICITSVEYGGQVVEGSFDVTLVYDRRYELNDGDKYLDPTLPDTIHFTQGHFRARVPPERAMWFEE